MIHWDTLSDIIKATGGKDFRHIAVEAAARHLRQTQASCNGTPRASRSQRMRHPRRHRLRQRGLIFYGRETPLHIRWSRAGAAGLDTDKTGVFGPERLTDALLDRLTRHVNILERNGESYRLSHSRENPSSQAPVYPEEEQTAPSTPSLPASATSPLCPI